MKHLEAERLIFFLDETNMDLCLAFYLTDMCIRLKVQLKKKTEERRGAPGKGQKEHSRCIGGLHHDRNCSFFFSHCRHCKILQIVRKPMVTIMLIKAIATRRFEHMMSFDSHDNPDGWGLLAPFYRQGN